MSDSERDMSKLSLRAFFGQLSTGQWWKIAGVLVAIIGASFTAGTYWASHFGESTEAQLGHRSRFPLTIESQKSYPVLDGRLLVALEPGATGEDRLDFRTTEGWGDSPSGPFLREAGHNGPRYYPGFRTYIKLTDSEVWSVSVLAVHEHAIDTEFMKWTD